MAKKIVVMSLFAACGSLLALTACSSSDSYGGAAGGGTPGTFHTHTDDRSVTVSAFLASGCDSTKDFGLIIDDTVKVGDVESFSVKTSSPFNTRLWSVKSLVDSRTETTVNATNTTEQMVFDGVNAASPLPVQKLSCSKTTADSWMCVPSGPTGERYDFHCSFTYTTAGRRVNSHSTLSSYIILESASVKRGEYVFSNNYRAKGLMIEQTNPGSYSCMDSSGKTVASGEGDRTVKIVATTGVKQWNFTGKICGATVVRSEQTIKSRDGQVMHSHVTEVTAPAR